MKSLKLISVLLLVITLACSEDSSTAPEKTISLEGQTYTNGIIGFAISAPADWQLETNKEIGGMQALLAGTKLNFSGMAPSFNLISSDPGEMKTSSELMKASESYINKTFQGVVFENSKTSNISGFDCAELIYRFNYNGLDLKQKQVLFLCWDKVSIAITFTAERYGYEDAELDFDSIVNSLKIL